MNISDMYFVQKSKRDMERDILKTLKVKEQYGFGVMNNGNGSYIYWDGTGTMTAVGIGISNSTIEIPPRDATMVRPALIVTEPRRQQ